MHFWSNLLHYFTMGNFFYLFTAAFRHNDSNDDYSTRLVLNFLKGKYRRLRSGNLAPGKAAEWIQAGCRHYLPL
jgi:hypothetical protein